MDQWFQYAGNQSCIANKILIMNPQLKERPAGKVLYREPSINLIGHITGWLSRVPGAVGKVRDVNGWTNASTVTREPDGYLYINETVKQDGCMTTV